MEGIGGRVRGGDRPVALEIEFQACLVGGVERGDAVVLNVRGVDAAVADDVVRGLRPGRFYKGNRARTGPRFFLWWDFRRPLIV